MQRRRFLQWGTAGVAAAALPGWMIAHFQTPRGDGDGDGWRPAAGRRGPLRAAWESAREQGRPLLVLTVPRDESLRWEQGQAWGELLNHGDSEVLCDLALCEVACAELAELRAALPDFPGIPRVDEREPIALLLETDSPATRIVTGSIDAVPNDLMWGESDAEALYVDAVRLRIAHMADALRAVIAPDLDTVERRARQAAEAQGIDPVALAPTGLIDAAYSERAAAAPACARLARDRGVQREALTDLLAGLAIVTLRRTPPTGARWASSSGCGIDVEGEEDSLVACGMAYVPEISRRFLDFYRES